jgi:hypothetical protein
MSANDWVKALQEAGFTKVLVLNSSFQTLATSGADAVASAWNDSEGKLVNENQSLADDWEKASSFTFFKLKCSVFQKSATHIVAGKGNDIVIGKQTPNNEWIVCSGKKKSAGIGKKKDAGKAEGGNFANPPAAYNAACKAVFDELDDD